MLGRKRDYLPYAGICVSLTTSGVDYFLDF
jgi:hypothetical protein